jgi:hypothetical protein
MFDNCLRPTIAQAIIAARRDDDDFEPGRAGMSDEKGVLNITRA